MEKDKAYYTVSEIAGISGVSARAIRFYDKKGLLKPVAFSGSGYRLYTRDSFAVLQQILMFKYLGFSLEQIRSMLKNDSSDPAKMREYLSRQQELLIQKKRQLENIIDAVSFAQECNENESWDSMLKLLSILSEEEKMAEQYRTDENYALACGKQRHLSENVKRTVKKRRSPVLHHRRTKPYEGASRSGHGICSQHGDALTRYHFTVQPPKRR